MRSECTSRAVLARASASAPGECTLHAREALGGVGVFFVRLFSTGAVGIFLFLGGFGIAAALDLRLTAMGAALFPVLAVVGITSSVHLLHAYGEARTDGADPRRAGWRAPGAVYVGIPALNENPP